MEADASIEAALARTERLKTQINDSLLKAPLRGRIMYRLAELASGYRHGRGIFSDRLGDVSKDGDLDADMKRKSARVFLHLNTWL